MNETIRCYLTFRKPQLASSTLPTPLWSRTLLCLQPKRGAQSSEFENHRRHSRSLEILHPISSLRRRRSWGSSPSSPSPPRSPSPATKPSSSSIASPSPSATPASYLKTQPPVKTLTLNPNVSYLCILLICLFLIPRADDAELRVFCFRN